MVATGCSADYCNHEGHENPFCVEIFFDKEPPEVKILEEEIRFGIEGIDTILEPYKVVYTYRVFLPESEVFGVTVFFGLACNAQRIVADIHAIPDSGVKGAATIPLPHKIPITEENG